jgi:hypothetical protein
MNAPSKAVRATSAVWSAETRVSRYDWETLSGDLNGYGCAVLEKLLSPDECRRSPGSTRGMSTFVAMFTWLDMDSVRANIAISSIRYRTC